ncbi:MAG: MFS transporter [Planctomycetales bacterium]|nr:MFS transporter [Planctomycetales bacterium]
MSGEVRRGTLLWASFLTLIAAGVGFAVRGGTLGAWAKQFGFTNTELGTITGGGLVGFGVVIVIGSIIAERINYKTVFVLAFILHILSAVITLAATPVYEAAGKDATYWCLYIGLFMFAVANGLCEAVINPLIATLYSKQKTHYLNILHAGWPGGLIIGGLLAACFLGENAFVTQLRWEIPMALFLIPTVLYGVIVFKEYIPPSEAGAAGVGFGTMLKEFAAPMLLFLLFLHACVGYVELGTDSWISKITESLLTGQGLILFVYASSIMFILRFFAGPIVERINPLGLLCMSALLGTTGLYTLGSVQSAAAIWIAVTIYGLGKTFLWPTMLGVVGERFPRGGALTMGAVGGIGMLSAGLLGGPGIGYTQDVYASRDLEEKAPETHARYVADGTNRFLFLPPVQGLDGQKVGTVLDEGTTLKRDFEILSAENRAPEGLVALHDWWTSSAEQHLETDRPPVHDAVIQGSRMALKWTAAVPATMFIGYLALVLYFTSRGGYTAVEIGPEGEPHETSRHPSAEDAIEEGEEGPSSGQA